MQQKIIKMFLMGAVLIGQSAPARSAGLEEALRPNQTLLDNDRKESGFKSLFNGKDLSGWDGNAKLWSVKEGAITGETTAENPASGNTFLIWTNGTVSDFELRCSFKLVPGDDQGFANSGIQYRSKIFDANNWVVGGYQADMEAGPTYTGILYEERMRGVLAGRGEKVVWTKDCQKQVVGSLGKSEELQRTIRQRDWNDYVIIAEGNHLQQFINGNQTVDVTDDCEAKAAKSGLLALQLHAGPPMKAQFRNIRLKSLPADGHSLNEDMKNLQGVWQVAKAERDGAPLSSEDFANLVVTISSNSWELINADSPSRGSFTVDSGKRPKQMDIREDAGPQAGETLLAIYELTPESLRVCYARSGAERPTSFTTAEDSGQSLITYKRKRD